MPPARAIALPSYADRELGFIEPEGGRVYLHPGEFTAARGSVTMTTILGSCVAVCLHDPVSRVGGLNHFLLPRAPGDQASARFGDVAVPWLIERMTRLGASVRRLQAKVIGGACVLDAYRGTQAHVGRQNVRVAIEQLAVRGIQPLAQDVEGHRARRVVFRADTGDLVVRMI